MKTLLLPGNAADTAKTAADILKSGGQQELHNGDGGIRLDKLQQQCQGI